MARALRPAVLLILVASLLFLVDGYLDGIYPGGPNWSLDAYSGFGWTSYLFAFVNAVVALLIARGSERMLALRIGLAAFFIFERPVSAVALGGKPTEALFVHLLTALVEAVILATTLRVWRLGHSFSDASLIALTRTAGQREAPLTMPAAPVTAAAAAAAGDAGSAFPAVAAPSRRGWGLRGPRFGRGPSASPVAREPEGAAEPPKPREPMAVRVRTISRGMTWALGLLSLLLAGVLVADGAAAGVVPGMTVDLASAEWLVYVFALVLLVVASRAVHGGRFAIRLLLVLALMYFVERAFTPFALDLQGATSLGLHMAGAFIALALALASAAALRAGPRLPRPSTA